MRNAVAALLATSSLLWAVGPIAGQELDSEATLEVQNNFEERVEVFIEAGRFDRRIGDVEPLSTAEIPLPEWVVERHDSVELFVAREGIDLETQAFEVQPGERIGLVVPPPEPRSRQMSVNLPPEQLSEATLTVENQRAEEMVIFAEEDELFEVRLGTVAPNTTATFEFPASVVSTYNAITVLVEPPGGREMESYPLQLEEGEHLGLRLTDQ